MTHIASVPLSQLTLSRHNIRRTYSAVALEEMVASIRANGLLQNLIGCRIPPDESEPAERFEVIAGGRRLRALQLLCERGELAASHPVPMEVRTIETATEIGLAENTVRERMHAHDEIVAFRDLVNAGHGIDTIADRFGVPPRHVEGRLKLANVSPVLLQLFRQDKLSIEQMKAFALVDDHQEQERIYKLASKEEWRLRPDQLREALTKKEIPTTNRRVQFVGLKRYLEAGGALRKDLFDAEGGGYIQDAKLLDRIFTQRFQEEIAALKAEGWSFVHVDQKPGGNSFKHECDRAAPAAVSEDDVETWTPEQKAKYGAMIALDYSGNVDIARGLSKSAPKKSKPAKKATKGKDGKPEPATLSEAMLRRLSAHRQIALHAALMKRADVALAVLAHALLCPLFYDPSNDDGSPLEIDAKNQLKSLDKLGFADIDASATLANTAKAISELRTQLGVPKRKVELFPWLLLQKPVAIHSLLQAAAVLSINTVLRWPKEKPRGELLAQALDLNMAEFWRPTADNFFSMVPKQIAIEAVREVHGAGQAERIAGMKKDAAAGECERLMANSGWLPKSLRRPGYALAAVTAGTAAASASDNAKPTLKKPVAKKATAKKSPAKSKPSAKKAKPTKKAA